MSERTFSEMNLAAPIMRALKKQQYTTPTPIQAAAIPELLKGRDLIGCAQTGTGKTAAFALPILNKLELERKRAPRRGARTLILTPTRELAAQVCDSFRTYGSHLRLNFAMVFGGVPQRPQVRAIANGVDVLVATPGRLLDLIRQKHLGLANVEVFVLDEADRMLDMGFMPDIKRIMGFLPAKRQNLLFSATMAKEIKSLAESMLVDPMHIAVSSPMMTADSIDERLFFVDKDNKQALLTDLLDKPEVDRVLVFTRTKHGADKLVKNLGNKANAIHGNKSQNARTEALRKFKNGRCKVLVATDIASRGIDVAGVTHVVNYDLPNEAESYVHRIGRTARAGATGVAISFCAVDERSYLVDIERLLKRSVPVTTDHDYHSERAASPLRRGSGGGKKTVSARNRYNPNQRRNKNRSAGKPGSTGTSETTGKSSRYGKPGSTGKPSRFSKPSANGKPSKFGRPGKKNWKKQRARV